MPRAEINKNSNESSKIEIGPFRGRFETLTVVVNVAQFSHAALPGPQDVQITFVSAQNSDHEK